MQENIELIELEKTLTTLKMLTQKMSNNLEKVNTIIRENINSGVGVWDSEMAGVYRSKWELLMEEFPQVLETFHAQESNLEHFITNMKKVEQ